MNGPDGKPCNDKEVLKCLMGYLAEGTRRDRWNVAAIIPDEAAWQQAQAGRDLEVLSQRETYRGPRIQEARNVPSSGSVL